MAEIEWELRADHVAPNAIGRIVSVNGSQAIVMLGQATPGSTASDADRTDMGTLLRIETPNSVVLGLVSAQSVPAPSPGSENSEIRIVELDMVGELIKDETGVATTFQRGVSRHPSLGDLVFPMTRDLLELAYLSNHSSIKIGSIIQDENIPATVSVDELLAKHFAVLGTTGTGKSCAVALTLNAILNVSPNAHILLIDPHNEYATAFGAKAEIITLENLDLPYWLFTFKEFSAVLFGSATDVEEEVDILAELIPLVKARYASNRGRLSDSSLHKGDLKTSPVYSVDTPSPYRISDLLELIDQRMGSLEMQHAFLPYKRLKMRIETVSIDTRFAFMFSRAAAQDQMAAVLGRLFRIPVDNKPIAIAELTGLPSETVNVLVSVICRLTFDFARRSGGQVPITIVCEEAHRYIPTDHKLGFEPTRRAIARIAKEGRKYGVSLCVVSQRPGELDPTILSQCNTIFALRLANEQDQKIVNSAVSDNTGSLLEFLPALGEREVIAFGDGVSLPMRFRFDELPAHALPRSGTVKFTDRWKNTTEDSAFVEAIVDRWRGSLSGEPEMTAEIISPATRQPNPESSPETVLPDLDEKAPEPVAIPAISEPVGQIAQPAAMAPRPAQDFASHVATRQAKSTPEMAGGAALSEEIKRRIAQLDRSQ